VCVDDRVRQLAADSGALITVHGRRAGAGFAAIVLVFEHGTLRLECNPDTDEVIASGGVAGNDAAQVLDDETLRALRGKVVELAWTMTNNRGFEDGFQLRCIDLDSRAEACVQFEAAAGVLVAVQVPTVG